MSRVAVIVSTWIGNPADYLCNLLATMKRYDAGATYDLCLCANGENYLLPPNLFNIFDHLFVRQNVGYNLGAWDHAWRMLPGYDYYLFMQDDCFIRRKGWLRDFIGCFESRKRCGLVGECLHKSWNRTWTELTMLDSKGIVNRKVSKDKVRRATYVRCVLQGWGIPQGQRANHLTSVVHFTSRAILEEVDGYNIAKDYQQAIAAEIGFSKKIEDRGYELVQIGRLRHSRIGHRQWHSDGFFARMNRSLRKRTTALQNILKGHFG